LGGLAPHAPVSYAYDFIQKTVDVSLLSVTFHVYLVFSVCCWKQVQVISVNLHTVTVRLSHPQRSLHFHATQQLLGIFENILVTFLEYRMVRPVLSSSTFCHNVPKIQCGGWEIRIKLF